MSASIHPIMTCPAAAFGKPVPRLGFASRGDHSLSIGDVVHALERGVRFINVPGLSEGEPEADPVVEAARTLGSLREQVVVCAQFAAREGDEARHELRGLLKLLATDYVDVLTLYYVEDVSEWDDLRRPRGVLDVLRAAKADGVVRRIGVTSHQRNLAAEMARSGELDTVMIRYNAAHRGAEREVFPVTTALRLPVIAYTATRWGRLTAATPDDPPGFMAPGAPDWYRFVLQHPAVSVALCAPSSREELVQDLDVLAATEPVADDVYARLAAHGARVRAHAGYFP